MQSTFYCGGRCQHRSTDFNFKWSLPGGAPPPPNLHLSNSFGKKKKRERKETFPKFCGLLFTFENVFQFEKGKKKADMETKALFCSNDFSSLWPCCIYPCSLFFLALGFLQKSFVVLYAHSHPLLWYAAPFFFLCVHSTQYMHK